jgi:hypothetical protein
MMVVNAYSSPTSKQTTTHQKTRTTSININNNNKNTKTITIKTLKQ